MVSFPLREGEPAFEHRFGWDGKLSGCSLKIHLSSHRTHPSSNICFLSVKSVRSDSLAVLPANHRTQSTTDDVSLPLPSTPLPPPSPSFRQGLRVRSPLSLLCTTLELRRGEDLKRSVCLCSSLVSSTPRPGPKGHLYAQRPLEWI